MKSPRIHVVMYTCSDYVQIIGIFDRDQDAKDAKNRFEDENPHLDYEGDFGCSIESYELNKYMPEVE